MKRMTSTASAAHLVMLGACLALAGCISLGLTSYSAEPITATVVDAETGQPLEGVNVIAHWQLEGGLEGGYSVGQMMVMEAVTDANGVFRFPAWGPRRVPAGLLNARLTDKDPRMFIFKSGYEYRELINEKSMKETDGKGPKVRSSQWNGKVIPLQKSVRTNLEYASMLSELGYEVKKLSLLSDDRNCYFMVLQQFTRSMKREDDRLRTQGLDGATYYSGFLANEDRLSKRGCGSVAEFLKGVRHE